MQSPHVLDGTNTLVATYVGHPVNELGVVAEVALDTESAVAYKVRDIAGSQRICNTLQMTELNTIFISFINVPRGQLPLRQEEASGVGSTFDGRAVVEV